ncbi:hypothetical protein NQ318_006397 [Aromia moschata]|uniref:TGF-beta family profile domain-containing protein n=1 Tax=Aromia moschata TaxID=1265417 RepID=A0AAV8YKE4_9CUCU|nr:hypothetical protein NQ318_006397 [Aromia moschata]
MVLTYVAKLQIGRTAGTAANKTDIPEFGSRGLSANCQRKEWNVSFKYLHWDPFIITPDGFTAYDCIGKCLKSQPDDANHVKLLHIFNKRTPCCVPRKYAPLPIMFYDRYGNVVIKNYRNMIITECGCR